MKGDLQLVKEIIWIAFPAFIAFLTHILVEIINLIFVGHLGKAALMAGVGIGNMYINIVAHSVSVGLNNGLSTYVSQCNGQGNLRLCGIYLNRGRFIALMAQIPI